MCLRLLHLPSVSLSVKSIYLIDFRLIFSLWFFGSVYICIYNYVKQGSQILENSLSSKYCVFIPHYVLWKSMWQVEII